MTSRFASLLTAVCTCLSCASALASPAIPITYTVSGTIDDVAWYPRKLIRKGVPDMSGSLGFDKYAPARYKVTLSSIEFEEPKDDFSRARVAQLRKSKTLTLTLRHEKNDGFLVKDMRIRIIDYKIEGDEGGTWHSFESVEILKRPEKPKDVSGAADVEHPCSDAAPVQKP